MSHGCNLSGRLLTVRVTPKASRARVDEVVANGDVVYRVYVTVVPEDGKANAEVIRLLAEHLGLAPSRLCLVKGQRGRDKVIRVDR